MVLGGVGLLVEIRIGVVESVRNVWSGGRVMNWCVPKGVGLYGLVDGKTQDVAELTSRGARLGSEESMLDMYWKEFPVLTASTVSNGSLTGIHVMLCHVLLCKHQVQARNLRRPGDIQHGDQGRAW